MKVKNSDFKIAQCRVNDWRACANSSTKTSCESDSDCKWVYGYRNDGKLVNTNNGRNLEEQGSCVLLVAPGLDFWKTSKSGNAICASPSVSEAALYETSWMTNRNKFASEPAKKAAESCLNNCYLIPGYGNNLGLKGMINLWDGNGVGGLASHFISLRKGHYCYNSAYSRIVGGSKGLATGKVSGNQINCVDSKRGRIWPLFFTNNGWLNSIRERTRSLGDCGYKPGIIGKSGSLDSERINVIFQKLKQDQSTVKSNNTIIPIYRGDQRLAGYRDLTPSGGNK